MRKLAIFFLLCSALCTQAQAIRIFSRLDQDLDVSITSVSSGHFLRYNGSAWVNTTIATGDVPTLNQDTTGSAAKLTTARNIGGVAFDGTAAIVPTNISGGNGTTLLGSIPYQSNTDTTTQLAPNTTTTKKFLRETGNGTNGAAPAWDTIVSGDVPTLNQNTTGSAGSLAGGSTGLMTITGMSTTNRAKTVSDAVDTILELGGSYTPTGTWTNMALTTPKITTGIKDVNANSMLAFTATASAVDGFTFTNAATAGHIVTMAGTGSDTNIDVAVTPKGNGNVNITHLRGSQAIGSLTPTNGTWTTETVVGSDTAGTITLTPNGTGPTNQICTVAFGQAYDVAPVIVAIPFSSTAQAASTKSITISCDTTNITITAGSVGLVSGTVYVWKYICIR